MKRIKFPLLFIIVSILLCGSVFGAKFTKSRTYNGNFKDVPSAEWFGESVKQVYELALMEGVAADRFDTESEMSVAQAITIAARLHSIYNGTTTPKSGTGNNWYMNFVTYCKNHKIITDNQFNNYNRAVLSFEMVELFAAALPKDFFPQKNDISYIQDVPENLSFADDVFLFYRAGILNGNDKFGTFLPMSAITRKRAAVILARTVLPELRLTYSLSPKRETYSVSEVLKILDLQTKKDTLDTVTLVTAGSYNVSAAEYRYYAFVSQNDTEKIKQQIKNTAAIIDTAIKSNLEIPYSVLCDILSYYYSNRTMNFGTASYFDALEAQKLSDSVYAKLITVNELSFYAKKAEAELISTEEVYNYAISNGYVCAKHVLITNNTPEAYKVALNVRLLIAEGESFDSLISKYGEDPGMKSRKTGYYFNKGVMVKEFETATYALKEGDISSIIETDYGYHIIKRLPIVKEELASSPDYATVAVNAGTHSLNSKYTNFINNTTLVYSSDFDNIVKVL